jgi:hypothetical protein
LRLQAVTLHALLIAIAAWLGRRAAKLAESQERHSECKPANFGYAHKPISLNLIHCVA